MHDHVLLIVLLIGSAIVGPFYDLQQRYRHYLNVRQILKK